MAVEIAVEKDKLKNRKLQENDILLEKSGGSPKQAIGRIVLYQKQEKRIFFW